MKEFWFLRFSTDTDDRLLRYSSKQSALDAFFDVAEELDRYGQPIEASLHRAPSRDQVAEYPDYVLSLGPRGGVRVEAA